MALPRLNESPQYELVIPSSGDTVKFRPFLVKEQKVLLIAYESKDQRQIIESIMNCIESCLQDLHEDADKYEQQGDLKQALGMHEAALKFDPKNAYSLRRIKQLTYLQKLDLNQ